MYAMLKNPFYYGEMKIRNEVMPHCYEPIISKTMYDDVQNVLSGNKIQKNRQAYAGIPFVSRKLVKCATCGCTITAETHTKKSGRHYRYLRCKHIRGNCHQELISEPLLLKQRDDEVFSKIKLNAKILELLKKCVERKLLEESEANMVIKRQITNELNKLEAQEKRIKDCFLTEIYLKKNKKPI